MTEAVFAPGDLVKARGREWVVLPSPDVGLLRMRPLSGSEDDVQIIAPDLELEPVLPARFSPPKSSVADTQDSARLLSDALRLSLRRGAGPFRCSAHLGVEPRAYQLVPLMMALKLSTIRLLIADDVGIGKTVEAGLVLREMLDRGAIDRFAVLCPPHLVDQWVSELSQKFDIEAAAVTASKARALEKELPASQSLFEAYPYTVVSLDYIKADRRRAEFSRACPNFVIVDEAHTCVGGGDRGRHLRYDVLSKLASDADRHMLLLTATPHSGDEMAFNRLLGLIHPDFQNGPPSTGDENARERYAYNLAQRLVQRRRADIESGGWEDTKTFPQHLEADAPYRLAGPYLDFHDAVLDYCLSVTERAGSERRDQRLAFWSTLALMRCVGSSPAAAGSALRNRRGGLAEKDLIEPVVFDEEDGLLDVGDIEPATAIRDQEDLVSLERLIEMANALEADPTNDPKFKALKKLLTPLVSDDDANPVIFCRFIATAKALGDVLSKTFRSHEVIVVTGELTPDERRARVDAAEAHEKRILVATDCLSEGINLQTLFNAVIHFDLSWNPTRHQQREGRVDRFGQPSPKVWSVTLFGENSAIDGAVLGVILRKAAAIRKATGISVPMPEDGEGVANALMQAMLLRRGGALTQGVFDFGDTEARMEAQWRDAEENAKASRARYAQGALKPGEVIPEWHALRALNGGPKEVERFVRRACARIGSPIGEVNGKTEIYLDAFPDAIKERLANRGITGTRRIRFEDDPKPKEMHVGRVHPIVATLAETLTEAALDPATSPMSAPLGRAGVWRTETVSVMTTVLLLRLRFKLVTSGRANRMLLAEEATGLAFEGTSSEAVLDGLDALALLEAGAAEKVVDSARTARLDQALERLPNYEEAIRAFATARGSALSNDHVRLTDASRGGATVDVRPVLPADVIGLYVLLPEAG
ncbi:MAG: DEAD/DEAH box helicase [Rhodospirillales bacterium]